MHFKAAVADWTLATDSNRQLTATEREDQDLEHALALSMSHALPHQETGVTDATYPYFGPANREHYDTKNWTMTLSGSHAREILLNPDPIDRKRERNAPAFVKPSPGTDYLPALITILHAIPAAREALLMRKYTELDYGHDKEWWDGAIIKAPKVVDVTDSSVDTDWDAILFEPQRLMAFLDQTERAYGSIAGLANMDPIRQANHDALLSTFLESWYAAAMQAEPGWRVADVFKSIGTKNVPDRLQEAFCQTFFCLEVRVSKELADTGQTLYEAVDDVLWAEWEETQREEVYLEEIGDVFAIQVTRADEAASGLGIKVPGTWYLDRYLEASKHAAREMLVRKAAFRKELTRLAGIKARMTEYKKSTARGETTEASKLMEIASAYFDRHNLQRQDVNGVEPPDEAGTGESPTATAALATVMEELRIVEDRVTQKLNGMPSETLSTMVLTNFIWQLWSRPRKKPCGSYKSFQGSTRSHLMTKMNRRITSILSVVFPLILTRPTFLRRRDLRTKTTYSGLKLKTGSGGKSATQLEMPNRYQIR